MDPVDKDNAEYPFPHVHTENNDDVDPITREVVNPVIGYYQRKTPKPMEKEAKKSLAALDPVDKENAEFWACMMTVCDDEHTERKQKEDKGGAYGQQQGLHSSIDRKAPSALARSTVSNAH